MTEANEHNILSKPTKTYKKERMVQSSKYHHSTRRQNDGKTYSSHEWAVTVFDFRTCPHLKRMTPADVWDSVDQSNLHGKSFHQWVFVLFAESNGHKMRRMYYYRAKKTIPPSVPSSGPDPISLFSKTHLSLPFPVSPICITNVYTGVFCLFSPIWQSDASTVVPYE